MGVGEARQADGFSATTQRPKMTLKPNNYLVSDSSAAFFRIVQNRHMAMETGDGKSETF